MKNYLKHFFLAVFVILVPFILLAWWAEPVSGDLARVGKWAEHDFGSNATHPDFELKATGRFIKNPDILVLGDSFSVTNQWQSVVSKRTNYAVKSYQYDNNCISKWVKEAILNTSSKIVVMEVAERSFLNRFRQVESCQFTDPVPMEVQAGVINHSRKFWPPTISLFYLSGTAYNTIWLNLYPEKYSKRFRVVNIPLLEGCARFSNRRSDRLLYYADDDLKQQWTSDEIRSALANISRIQKEVEKSGKIFLLVVAPDKSSVYHNCFLYNSETFDVPNIFELLTSSGIKTLDLKRVFSEKINAIEDLYEPDDTHWGVEGYELAGNKISEYLSMPVYLR